MTSIIVRVHAREAAMRIASMQPFQGFHLELPIGVRLDRQDQRRPWSAQPCCCRCRTCGGHFRGAKPLPWSL